MTGHFEKGRWVERSAGMKVDFRVPISLSLQDAEQVRNDVSFYSYMNDTAHRYIQGKHTIEQMRKKLEEDMRYYQSHGEPVRKMTGYERIRNFISETIDDLKWFARYGPWMSR